jgi:hypothetical protein
MCVIPETGHSEGLVERFGRRSSMDARGEPAHDAERRASGPSGGRSPHWHPQLL